MPKFEYTMKIEATDKSTSIKVMESLTSLAKTMTPADLEFFAKKVKENPGLIAQAKNFL